MPKGNSKKRLGIKDIEQKLKKKANVLTSAQRRNLKRKLRRLKSEQKASMHQLAPSSSPDTAGSTKKKKKKKKKPAEQVAQVPSVQGDNLAKSSNTQSNRKLSKLQQKYRAKLQGGQFRWLNEQLYTQSGEDSFQSFAKNPSLFDAYHEGYRKQVLGWPKDPLDHIINIIRKKPKWVVADMGCGAARLAKTCTRNKVHSFDLVSHSEHVVACNIAHVPLEDNSVDCCVFSLSLMGTDFHLFLVEAKRILKKGGTLLIAEVSSRFGLDEEEDSKVRDERFMSAEKGVGEPVGEGVLTIESFNQFLKEMGFALEKFHQSKMFVFFRMKLKVKTNGSQEQDEGKKRGTTRNQRKRLLKERLVNDETLQALVGKARVALRPCRYKKR